MERLQAIYLVDNLIDITECHSATAMSFKIYRAKYLKAPIPVLTQEQREFVSPAYFGGATEYYELRSENLYHYDVNSMYPAMMVQDRLPILPVGKIGPIKDWKSFYGYVECKVECPLDFQTPILPCKHEGKTIYPTGTWLGTYFSEHVKLAESLGYTITPLRGLQFRAGSPFNSYIQDFYHTKSTTKDAALKGISKLHLNTL
uniref:DNA-directed DNA polymerase n=1 Tax=Volvariella volvacea TaxID=36659 RepID=A0A5H2QC85_9AGAR|nr:hypothetical protein [Volvariella volvacea]AYD91358.1 hypothetical protein [Volvariella volvacea]AYD91390.1 hypothetical protein [Volvariella volvacea]